MNKLFVPVFVCVFASALVQAQTPGCTDPVATNFQSTATQNNGTCTYGAATLTPTTKFSLNTSLNETSGIIWWNGKIWTHQDSGNPLEIYAVDTTTGNIDRTVTVTNATTLNMDWEDIAQDDDYIYIGDFGNNASGNRTNLKIYKIAKADVLAGDNVTAEIINFSYADQTDFTATSANNTDFDCEALISYGNSLFLFSKNWVNHKTKLYELPKTAGTYIATNNGELDVQGLITGADVLADRRTIVLVGYSTTLAPFIYLLYDFSANSFFGANKRKVALNAGIRQVEGVAIVKPDHFFISNELRSPFTVAQLQTIGVGALLGPYYQVLPVRDARLNNRTTTSDVILNWELIGASNTDYFEIERKTESDNQFASIYKFHALKGSYTDASVLKQHQTVHYRIKITDRDQSVSYSRESVAKGTLKNDYLIEAGVNKLSVTAYNKAEGIVEISAYDGTLKLKKQITAPRTVIDISFLPAGMYIAKLFYKEKSQTFRFIKP
jgi:hypothetical protein